MFFIFTANPCFFHGWLLICCLSRRNCFPGIAYFVIRLKKFILYNGEKRIGNQNVTTFTKVYSTVPEKSSELTTIIAINVFEITNRNTAEVVRKVRWKIICTPMRFRFVHTNPKRYLEFLAVDRRGFGKCKTKAPVHLFVRRHRCYTSWFVRSEVRLISVWIPKHGL